MQYPQYSADFSPLTLDASATAAALPFDRLCNEIRQAIIELHEQEIVCPERQILPFGKGGQMSSLPSVSYDLGVHKLVTYLPHNPQHDLPSIHGIVTAWDIQTGRMLAELDGITITARRTAALSMVAMQLLCETSTPRVVIIGTGAQASSHLQALETIYPGARVQIKGTTLEQAEQFCRQYRNSSLSPALLSSKAFDEVDVVITATTSRTPVYHCPPVKDRLLIGVGAFIPEMAEYAPEVVLQSDLFIDEPLGGRREAGDYLQAGVDWSTVTSLAEAMKGKIDFTRPRMFKCVGGAAFDLAAVRCALRSTRI